ncbi:MAG: hypothetical protein CMC48_01245 [Flavobacteriaceae bacterium]|nr:hypothetical protein [Flavobacteriaceae bacterium]|tara:strand:- start:4832 stop:7300 length:2469 start_codon:yes stop_codon:yes gene_type:complete
MRDFYSAKICVLFVSIIILLISCDKTTSTNEDLVSLIPQNSDIIVRVNDIQSLINKLQNDELLKNLYFTKDISQKVKNLINDSLNNQIIAFSNFGKKEKAITVIHKRTKDSTYLKYEKIIYSGEIIFKFKKANMEFYKTFIQNNTIVGNSRIVIENCIRNYQQQKKGINDENFKEIFRTADQEKGINLFLKGEPKLEGKSIFKNLPLFPKILESWSSLDVDIENEIIEIDGAFKIRDSLGEVSGLLKNIKPLEFLVSKSIPNTYESLLIFNIDDLNKFEINFKKLVEYKNYSIKKLDLSFLEFVNQIALVKNSNENQIIFHTLNQDFSNKMIIDETKEFSYRNVKFFKLSKSPSQLKLLTSILADETDVKWISYLDEFIFLSETQNGIKNLIASYKDGQVAEKTGLNSFYEKSLSNRFNTLWISKTDNLITTSESSNILKDIDTKKFPLLGFQTKVDENFVIINFRLQKFNESERSNDLKRKFIVNLENETLTSPQWIKNHRTKEKDILVQDYKNKIYLFSNQGKLYWKKNIDGNIIGKVKQVDLFKNGRLQIAFRTSNRLYILDRNGKNVKPFPIKIPNSKNLTPLSVFDYDKNRNYRFLLTLDNNILMYDKNAKKVNGFKFKKTKSSIINSPKHIRFDSKDYIISQEANGNLKILNRQGKTRIKVKGEINFSRQEIYPYLSTFTGTDLEGNLIQIDTRGNILSSNLNLSKNHKITIGYESLVTLSENKLTIKGIPITLPYGNYTKPKIFKFSDTIYITTTDTESEKVYLFKESGKTVKGFPVYGTTSASLSKSKKSNQLELVVGSEKKDIVVYSFSDTEN